MQVNLQKMAIDSFPNASRGVCLLFFPPVRNIYETEKLAVLLDMKKKIAAFKHALKSR